MNESRLLRFASGGETGDRGPLHLLADELRADEVISPRVRDSDEPAGLGLLVAAGPRAAEDPGTYAVLFEAIREGFLAHYGHPRLLDDRDPDLLLLAGDYLYALGLERLAARGDLTAVAELADLISLCAQLHARAAGGGAAETEPLWLAAAVAVGAGPSAAHRDAKRALRSGDTEAPAALLDAAAETANGGAMRDALAAAADSIGFPAVP